MNNAFALPAIQSGNGSLEQYIHTVNSIPMLTLDEETHLAERQRKGDLNAAKQLILPTFVWSFPSHAAMTATD